MKLNSREQRLWHAWKRASESVRARVAQDLSDAVGISDPDFGILSRLADASGSLRQNQLASSLGWHRSRLSHQLKRMEERGLVTRRTAPSGVTVLITTEGAELIQTARPLHAAAVRQHLTGIVPAQQLEELSTLLEQIAYPDGAPRAEKKPRA